MLCLPPLRPRATMLVTLASAALACGDDGAHATSPGATNPTGVTSLPGTGDVTTNDLTTSATENPTTDPLTSGGVTSTASGETTHGETADTTTDATTTDGGSSGGGELPPMPTQKLLIGYNEAWWGGAFATGYTTDWDLAYVRKTLDGISEAGGNLVRIWLWPVPQGYTLAPAPPQTQQVSQEFLDNVDTTLTEARKRGLWVYVTLLDGNTIAEVAEPLHTYGVNLLNNYGGELVAFQDKALAPLLTVLDAHQDNVFGIDIINEIQAAYKKGVFPDANLGPRAFILGTAAFIKARSPWVRVTSSAGWPDDIFQSGAQYDIAKGFYSGLGLDFYDVHAYSDSGTYPGATAMCQRAAMDGVPVYLGEFGQKSESMDDTLQYNATASFLNNSLTLCLSGAFAWRYDAAEKWWAFVRPDDSYRPAVAIMQVFGAQP